MWASCGDELSHGWWDSLLQNLRDRLSPERLAPLQLTSHPVAAFGADSSLQILDWSTLDYRPEGVSCPMRRRNASVVASWMQPTAAVADTIAGAAPSIRAAGDPRAAGARHWPNAVSAGRSGFRLATAEAVFFLVAHFQNAIGLQSCGKPGLSGRFLLPWNCLRCTIDALVQLCLPA